MNHSSILLVILALAFAGCAATGSIAHGGGDISGQENLIGLGGEIVFVEGPEEGGAFLPAELLKLWLQEEELAAGKIELVSRGVRRGPAGGVRRPPLLNARPPIDPA